MTKSEYDKERYKRIRKEKLAYQKEYQKTNREKYLEYQKSYNKNNKEKYKDYRALHKERYDQHRKNWRKKQENNPLYKLTKRVRSLTLKAIKRAGYDKKSKTAEILGIDFESFKNYIESQFIEGMSWGNFGEWHIDHKTPISWGKNEEEILELSHYKNLQPLWAGDNLSKGNRFKS